jgi:hypothetical protein
MSVITKGKTFANGEQLTAGKLNQMLDAATFSSAAVDNTKTTLSGGAITIAPSAITATEVAQSFLDTIYPVGSVYINASDGTNPGTLLGFGTWTAFGAGRVPVGIDSSGSPDTDFDTAEETGGAKTHTLSIAEMPAHDHVDNRNEFDSNNILLRRSSSGTGSPNGGDSSVGEVQVLGANAYDDPFPRIEGSGSAHNNLQPYIVVYMWKRTA